MSRVGDTGTGPAGNVAPTGVDTHCCSSAIGVLRWCRSRGSTPEGTLGCDPASLAM